MARTSLLVHIVMIVIAGTIGFLYIYPMIGQIRENQDTAVTFNREVTRVSAVNGQLQQKLSAINSIPIQDKQKLVTYMPDTLDDVMFMRTMEAILISSGIEPASLQFGGGNAGEGDQAVSVDEFEEFDSNISNTKTVKSDISVAFEADETSLFSFFAAVERSSVPFVVKEVTLAPSEGGGITAELVYSVHALSAQTSNTGVQNTMSTMDFSESDIDF
ncbi:MAG: hypothetical protein ACK42D_02450 [Candidatus Paceibacteria bacterium]